MGATTGGWGLLCFIVYIQLPPDFKKNKKHDYLTLMKSYKDHFTRPPITKQEQRMLAVATLTRLEECETRIKTLTAMLEYAHEHLAPEHQKHLEGMAERGKPTLSI